MNFSKWKIAASVFFIILILRAPAFWTPILDIDESQFAGYANALLSGGLPYVDSVDTKPLGIYYFFAAVFALFGHNNMIAVHVATAVVVGLTALYCFRIARLLYSERAGILAALFYAIFTTTYVPKFISTSIVIIMMLPLTMSIYYMIVWEVRSKWRYLWYAGAFFGIASCFKYQAGITLVVVAFYLLIFSPLYRHRSFSKPKIKALVIYLAGGAAVGLIFVAHLVWLGVFKEFWFWSVHGSVAYVEAGGSVGNFPIKLLTRGGTFVASTLLIWYFGVRRIAVLVKNVFSAEGQAKKRCEEYLVFIWFIFNLAPVCAGGRFYGHYFIQILPPLVILAAAEADGFLDWLVQGKAKRRHQIAYALFAIGLLVPALGFFGARLLADEIYKKIGEENPKSYKPIADLVRERTKQQDKIFVWGFATPVYFFSDRESASRFLWCDWLTGRVPGSPTVRDRFFDTSQFTTRGSWDMLFYDLEKNRPVYFIDTVPGNYHDYSKYPVSKYPRLVEYLNKHYKLEERFSGADFYRRVE